ncbi:MAG: VWA domain-containing protein, partial [Planctomycetota bacterium]
AEPKAGPRAGGRTPPAGPPDAELFGRLQALRKDGLEVVIVMDSTGSMASVIGAAAGRSASLVRRLAWLVPRFRAGLVTYDDQARLREPLTTDGEVLREAFRKVSAHGGGDWEEGVDKGIALALVQDQVGWSRRAYHVIVVVGDAPPHAGDVTGLLRRIRRARDDVLFEHPVTIHTVATTSAGVDHFGVIARAGKGAYVTLARVGRLEEELVTLVFGPAWRDRVRPWLQEVETLRGSRGRNPARRTEHGNRTHRRGRQRGR